jgi:hypothetical protein
MIPKALGQLLGLLTPVEVRVGGVLLGIEAALALRIIYRLAASASALLSGTQLNGCARPDGLDDDGVTGCRRPAHHPPMVVKRFARVGAWTVAETVGKTVSPTVLDARINYAVDGCHMVLRGRAEGLERAER